MFLFSATFFPLTVFPTWLRWVVEVTPLYRGVVLCRELTPGSISWASLISVVYLVVMGLVGLRSCAGGSTCCCSPEPRRTDWPGHELAGRVSWSPRGRRSSAGLWAFEPWRLFTSSAVDEAPPDGCADRAPTADADRPGQRRRSAAGSRPGALAAGRVRGRRARHLRHSRRSSSWPTDGGSSGSRDLATSDGPDLHVWLTDRPSGGDWGSYDDGALRAARRAQGHPRQPELRDPRRSPTSTGCGPS